MYKALFGFRVQRLYEPLAENSFNSCVLATSAQTDQQRRR